MARRTPLMVAAVPMTPGSAAKCFRHAARRADVTERRDIVTKGRQPLGFDAGATCFGFLVHVEQHEMIAAAEGEPSMGHGIEQCETGCRHPDAPWPRRGWLSSVRTGCLRIRREASARSDVVSNAGQGGSF
jgi:hypothetical protein